MSPPTPLAILLSEMRRKWKLGDKDGAVALARLAAPYLHARVQPTKPAAEVSKLTDADLDELCNEAGDDEAGDELCGAEGAAASDQGPA